MAYRKVLRPASWQAWFLVAALGFTVAGIRFLYETEGMSWVVIGLATLSFLFLLGIVDFRMSKIVLGEDTLDIIELFSHQSYPRSEFVSVKVDGGRVCLERIRGNWLILPDTGGNALGVCNSVRAWLNERDAHRTP